MKRFLIITPILFLLLFFAAENSYACSCVYLSNLTLKQEVEAAFTNSVAVFSAEVLEINEKPNVYNVSVKFKVNKSWKGIKTKEIVLTTGRGGGDCGYRFEVGKKYLVYAYGKTNELGTGICSRTAFVEGNKDIKILTNLKKKKT